MRSENREKSFRFFKRKNRPSLPLRKRRYICDHEWKEETLYFNMSESMVTISCFRCGDSFSSKEGRDKRQLDLAVIQNNRQKEIFKRIS